MVAIQALTLICGVLLRVELLYGEGMSKASCMYAFGVVLWELLASKRAWPSLSHAQVQRLSARSRQHAQHACVTQACTGCAHAQ